VTRAPALAALLAALEERLADAPADVRTAWSARDALRGRPIHWEGGEGVARGIDDTGALIVDGPAGEERLLSGEVALVRPAEEG
jgi:biotin-(acetyl-CoA carboxylase) ligase